MTSELVLITGGAGFIGGYLTRKLKARGHQVAIMDNLHPQVHTDVGLPDHVKSADYFFAGDVTSAGNWASLFRHVRPTVVLHLAAETGTGQSLTEAHRHASVNVDGTAQLIDALTAAKIKPKRIFLSSSRAVYGDGQWKGTNGAWSPEGRSAEQLSRGEWDYRDSVGGIAVPLESAADRTPPNPVSVYGATKLAQEHILSCWARAFGVPLTTMRFQNVYGPGQAPGNPYTGVVTFFVQQVLKGQTLDVYEDGNIIRDFVHVEDVSDAVVASVESNGTGVELMDIGFGTHTTILEVAQLLSKISGSPAPRISGKFRNGDVRAASCSIRTAVEKLGYKPQWPLERGLQSVLDWSRSIAS